MVPVGVRKASIALRTTAYALAVRLCQIAFSTAITLLGKKTRVPLLTRPQIQQTVIR